MDEILLLVRQGLSEETILEMPVTVFELYRAAAQRDEARRRYTDIGNMITAIGHSFGGKGTKDILTDLEAQMEQD